MDPRVWLVVIGVALLLISFVVGPVYSPLSTPAFWLGVILLALGIVLIILGG